MEKQFLTVKELAELAGVSVQSIYKKLGKPNNPIQRYCKVVDGVKCIDRRALDILYNAATVAREAETVEPVPQVEEPPKSQNSTDRLLDILERQLEEQRRQLQEKDNQIAEQNKQISSLLARLEDCSRIIDQQQQLTAMNTQALLTAETVEPEKETEIVEPQPPQKQSFWGRLFGKG
jgi:hypothetical protein